MSVSGKDSGSSPITQANYELSQAEKDNIFAVSTSKILGVTNSGASGVESSNGDHASTNVYTTAVGG